MATNVVQKVKSKISARDFAATVGINFSESIGDMIVTVAVTGVSLTFIFNTIPAVYANTIPGLYILGMLVQLFIRIVHRFDDSYTTNELAERMIEFEESTNSRLDKIIEEQNIP